VEVGEADRVCTRPRDDYTRRLLASLPGEGPDREGGERWQPKVS
jgi:ABC-type dipeptide/oligopeptide/nickel transport system ATPase component